MFVRVKGYVCLFKDVFGEWVFIIKDVEVVGKVLGNNCGQRKLQ